MTYSAKLEDAVTGHTEIISSRKQRVSRVIPHLCGMPKRLRDKRLLAMMSAFFDESGLNPHTDKALVFGGFLGTVEEWERVSDAWDVCLSEHPKIDYFKSDEANHLGRRFARFSRATAEQKKNSLAEIIGQSQLQGFCATVCHEWFANRDIAATKSMIGGRAYDWGFLTATSGVLQYIRTVHPSETVDFIFDRRRELRQCISIYEELKSIDGSLWLELMKFGGSCQLGDDKEIVALQMADLLAGEFSAMVNSGNDSSEAWKRMVARYPVAHIPCQLPPLIPTLLATRSVAREIQASNSDFLRRFYKEHERSPKMLEDLSDIVQRVVFFQAATKPLMEMFEADPEFRKLRERKSSK